MPQRGQIAVVPTSFGVIVNPLDDFGRRELRLAVEAPATVARLDLGTVVARVLVSVLDARGNEVGPLLMFVLPAHFVARPTYRR